MFERFTEGAIRTIMLAQEEARRLGHGYVGTEHILLGLIGQNDSKATTWLKQKGIDLAAARTATETVVGRGDDDGKKVEIPFTDRAKRALEASWDASKARGERIINTDHLLSGILSQKDSSGVKVLSALTDVSQLSQALEA